MLSIIMPVYNAAKYLAGAVDSVLHQTFHKFELILVDDGSSDGSGELCDALASTDSRIRVIHQANAGVAAARNVGLDAAIGEYIGWVDSDDLVHPEMYRIMLTLMEQYSADIVQCVVTIRILVPCGAKFTEQSCSKDSVLPREQLLRTMK